MPAKPAQQAVSTRISPDAFRQLTELQAAIGEIQRPVPLPRVPQAAVIEVALAHLHEAHEDGRLATELEALA